MRKYGAVSLTGTDFGKFENFDERRKNYLKFLACSALASNLMDVVKFEIHNDAVIAILDLTERGE